MFQTVLRRLALFLTLLAAAPICGHAVELTGVIKGQVVDRETREPLPGANILIENTQWGAAADQEGRFAILKVPVGSCVLRFELLGYKKVIKTDVIVKSSRITVVDVELSFQALEMEGMEVTSGYFSATDDQPVSAISLDYEEIRRSAGSYGDVSRIISVLPSVAPSSDQTNNLVVRGGNPGENAFYVDNIQIPNINHFPTQGSAGGALGVLNVELIKGVDFYSGGFSSAYGDRLSSVMDISLREGRRDGFEGQIDLNWAGFGLVGEGPLPGQKGSWLVSARRSYLDLLVKTIDVGNTIAPRYGDIQAKVVYDLNKNHQLTLLEISSDDQNTADRQTAIDNEMIVFMDQKIQQNTAGINWRALWNKSGYSNTSLAYTRDRTIEDMFDTGTEAMLMKRRAISSFYTLRNVNHFSINSQHAVEFGLEAQYTLCRLKSIYGEQWDPSGKPLPPLDVFTDFSVLQQGIFINYSWAPFRRLSIQVGARADYHSKNRRTQIAPRASLAFTVSPTTTLNAAAGIYHQRLPVELAAQNKSFENLNNMKATHFIVGITQLLTENTKFSLEIYRKEYTHFPMDPQQPGFFIIDEPFYNNGFYRPYAKLLDSGRALSQGVEIMLQKKLAKNIYGLLSASWFRSLYHDIQNITRNRTFDQRFLVSAEGGYKPNKRWEFSLHWTYSGGRPFTPFDVQASSTAKTGILDPVRVNAVRYPNFNWLNIRVDRRFNFHQSNLVAYLSIYNVLGQKNVSAYYWHPERNEQEIIYQWGSLPIFGIEYEF